MEKIKKVYYYLFYKLYKHSQSSVFPNDFAASIFLGVLGIWFSISILNYYNVFIDRNVIFSKNVYIGIATFFLIVSYITIDYNNSWKKYIQEFDKLPKEKNRKGSIIVWSIIGLIIFNTIFSYYLLFARAKREQTGPYAPEFVAQKRKEDSLKKAQQIENLKKIYGEDKK